MATKVVMPQLGESVVEGTVSKWLKDVGESVAEYEALLEVSTDKVDSEIPAPAAGTILEIYVEAGSTVDAGTLLCLIGQPGEKAADSPSPTAYHGNGKSESHPVEISREEKQSTRLSPVVARMVSEHKVDLQKIKGTGQGGRVTKKDVEQYLENQPQDSDLPPWERPGSGDLFKPTDGGFEDEPMPAPRAVQPPAPAVSTPPRAIPVEPIPQGVPGELMQLSTMRRAIADHMVQSKLHIAPHVTTVFEADLTAVLAHLNTHKPQLGKQGINLTLTAYFVSAIVSACQAYPIINSQWTDEGIYLHHQVHVGMAVALDNGLIVPVIKNAERLNLVGLAAQVNDLAQRARNKQLSADDIKGGTITLTNHGVSGSIFATPIINQPQSAIVGVGMMEKRVKVINDAIAIRPCCYISLTFDHRVADGATADGFMMTMKNSLENWPER